MKKLTLKDIAQVLNKSVSTVSRALADSHEIGEETKSLVRKYALEQKYEINRSAKSLRTGKYNLIGVILPTLNSPFFLQLLEGIDEQLSNTDYNIIIMQSKDDRNLERKCIENLYVRGIDGIIISPTGDQANIKYLQSLLDQNLPIVIVDRTNKSLKTQQIGINGKRDVYHATEHILQNGYSKILYLTGKNLGPMDDRFLGYKKCLNNYRIPIEPNFILEFDLHNTQQLELEITNKIRAVLTMVSPPDAIFTATDILTNSIIGILNNLNMRIPEDMAVIGFSNLSCTQSFDPPLSHIWQPARAMASIAITKLMEMLNPATYSKRNIVYNSVQLETKTFIRQSSASSAPLRSPCH